MGINETSEKGPSAVLPASLLCAAYQETYASAVACVRLASPKGDYKNMSGTFLRGFKIRNR